MVAVRPEQGPPLVVPVTFFLTGPLFLFAAGLFVAVRADDGIATAWAPSNVALVHLGVVGLLLFTMLGALYQLLPVVAGAVVPAIRLAHAVHALLVLGAGFLVWGQATGSPTAFIVAGSAMLAALGLFLGPSLYAAVKSRVKGPTAAGLVLALVALGVVGLLGLRLATVRAGSGFTGEWLTLRWAHAHVGFLCWAGGLIAAVSWQVLPMFFFVSSPPSRVAWGVTAGVAVSLVALPLVTLFDLPSWSVRWAALPAALAVWLVQPAWALVGLSKRRRKRKDATLYGWVLAMGAAPLCLLAAAASAWLDAFHWPVTYGLLVVWAWAGMLAHAMLTRIVPFLVWLHWCAPRVGQWKMRSAKELLTDHEVTVGVVIHAASVVVGVAATVAGDERVWKAFGGTLALTAVAMVFELLVTLKRGRTPLGPRSPVASGA